MEKFKRSVQKKKNNTAKIDSEAQTVRRQGGTKKEKSAPMWSGTKRVRGKKIAMVPTGNKEEWLERRVLSDHETSVHKTTDKTCLWESAVKEGGQTKKDIKRVCGRFGGLDRSGSPLLRHHEKRARHMPNILILPNQRRKKRRATSWSSDLEGETEGKSSRQKMTQREKGHSGPTTLLHGEAWGGEGR